MARRITSPIFIDPPPDHPIPSRYGSVESRSDPVSTGPEHSLAVELPPPGYPGGCLGGTPHAIRPVSAIQRTFHTSRANFSTQILVAIEISVPICASKT